MTPLTPTLQALLGLLLGLGLGAVSFGVGLLRLPIPLAGWIAIFATLWIACFYALKKGLSVLLVTAFLTSGLITLLTNHLLPTP